MPPSIIKSIASILFVFLSFSAICQTNVSGNLSENASWTKEGSPYNVIGNIGVPTGISLTIESGVTVNFAGNYEILVFGEININGLPTDSVYFNGNSVGGSGTKKMLEFRKTDLSMSSIEYVTFSGPQDVLLVSRETEFDQDSPKVSGELIFSDCIFKNSIIQTDGYNSNGKLKIENSKVENMLVKGRYPRTEPISFSNCEILSSTIFSDSYNKGIAINNSIVKHSDFKIGCCGANFNIKYSKLYECDFISENDGHVINISNSIIMNTSFEDNYRSWYNAQNLNINTSVILLNESSTINYEDISINNSYINGNGAALAVDSRDLLEFSSNTIEDCYTSLAFEGDGNISNSNFINNTIPVEIKGDKDINGPSNFWGLQPSQNLNDVIIDQTDDLNLGKLNFDPIKSTIIENGIIMPPKEVFMMENQDGVYLKWNANENFGYKIYYEKEDSLTYAEVIDVGNVNEYTIAESISGSIAMTAYFKDSVNVSQFKGTESWFSKEGEFYFKPNFISSEDLCQGTPVEVGIKSGYHFSDTNHFILQLSDPTGSFDNAVNLDSIRGESEILSSLLPDTLDLSESYSLRVLSSELNLYSNSSEVTLYESPTSSFSSVQTSCQSDTVILKYSGELMDGLSFNWHLNGGEILENVQDSLLKVRWSSFGLKEISLETTLNGCTSTSSQSINIIKTPTSDFSVPSLLCEGETASITYLGNGADTATYSWDFDGGVIIEGSSKGPYKISWDTFGEKNISLSVIENGCSSVVSKSTINFYESPTSSFSSVQTSCQSDSVTLKYDGTLHDELLLNWNLNGGQIVENIQDSLLTVFWTTPGQKEITLQTSLNGCSNSSSQLIDIIKTPTSDFSVPSLLCEGETATITYLGNGADTATYSWDFDGGVIIEGSGKGPYEISWDTFGEKNISLSVVENGCVSENNSQKINYRERPSLLFEAQESSCFNTNFEISFTGSNYSNIEWDFYDAKIISGSGAGPYLLNWDTPGQKTISLDASNNGCLADTTLNINVLPEPEIPEICMITVDEGSSKNKLIWSHDSETMHQFGIYRETNVAGEYALVEYVNAEANNTYIDNQSIPEQQSNRYKITSRDSCGTETEFSDLHKTIHLTINKGNSKSWNLIWDGYEGFSFGTYRIYRSLDGGDFELLTEIASNLSSYTDTNVPTSDVAYQIEVLNPNQCESNLNESAPTLNSSKSNIARNETVTALNKLEESVMIFPNPIYDILNIRIVNNLDADYSIQNMMGQVVDFGTLNDNNVIDMADLPSGFYILIIKTSNGEILKRILKE